MSSGLWEQILFMDHFALCLRVKYTDKANSPVIFCKLLAAMRLGNFSDKEKERSDLELILFVAYLGRG